MVNEPPNDEFWFEEVMRGSTEVLIVMFGADSRGSIECHSYAEKAAWVTTLEAVNSTWRKLSKE